MLYISRKNLEGSPVILLTFSPLTKQILEECVWEGPGGCNEGLKWGVSYSNSFLSLSPSPIGTNNQYLLSTNEVTVTVLVTRMDECISPLRNL